MISNNTETQLLQRAFRNLMNAYARPGLLGEVEPCMPYRADEQAPLPPCFEMVVRTLVDQAVTFAVLGTQALEASRWVSLRTHSHKADVKQAQYVLVPDVANSASCREAILQAYEGTLLEPEKGATIIVACGAIAGDRLPGDDREALQPQGKYYRVMTKGPGIKDSHTFFVDRDDWIWARQDRGDEYPCGIDVILVDEAGHIAGIPRTTKIVSVEKEGSGWDM